MVRIIQIFWRLLPAPLRYWFWQNVGVRIRTYFQIRRLARSAGDFPASRDAPLVVAGLFRTANGIGEAARTTYRALRAAGLQPVAVDLSAQLSSVDLSPDIPLQTMPDSELGVLILQLNGPETIPALSFLDMTRDRSWFTIGYWAWELPVFPETWDQAFPFLSEIWAISSFTADAIGQHRQSPPIEIFGHAVCAPPDVSPNRARFSLPDDTFVFLTLGDSMSSMDRKNCIGAIKAHLKAFGDDDTSVLVVKTRNLEHAPKAKHDIEAAIGPASNIILLDEALSEYEIWQLLTSVDAVISLHRSEGFGLSLAQAMSIGKPVIATNWSGNTDFMTDRNAILITPDLVPCNDVYEVYNSAGAVWAEIDVDEAARQMRQLAKDGNVRNAISVAAKADIQACAAPETVGQAMANRLETLRKGLSGESEP